MEDIDAEVLITLVEARPVLWDKFLDTYKDRNATKDAWHEVCVELHPEFAALDAKDKNAFGKEVLRRWTNLRDSFSMYNKKIKSSKASGSKAIKSKKYVYFDQLQFLSKVYVERETVDSMEQSKEQENEGEESMELQLQASNDVLGVSTPVVTKSTGIPKARKHKKPDEVELRILKAVEGEKPCSKMSFLQSLMPHLQKFNDEEFLQFQIGVLNVIGNINEKKKAMYPHPPHYSHQQFPTYPQPHFVHPSTTTQCQSQQLFNTPNQPPFYREQFNMLDQTSSTYAQMPIPNQSQPSTIGNNQAPLLQEISSHSSGGSKEPSPVSRYFSDFPSPGSEENSRSITSVASSIADSVDFGSSN